MVRLIHLLPGNPEYPRDTFAGKMRMRFWRPCPSCEKVVRILPAKVSRRCPYQLHPCRSFHEFVRSALFVADRLTNG